MTIFRWVRDSGKRKTATNAKLTIRASKPRKMLYCAEFTVSEETESGISTRDKISFELCGEDPRTH